MRIRRRNATNRRPLTPWQSGAWVSEICADVLLGEGAGELARAIGLATTQSRFMLMAQGREIRMKRSRSRAREVIGRLSEALGSIEYIGPRPSRYQFSIVGRTTAGELLLIGAKLVRPPAASSGLDELIISTAYFIDDGEMKRKLGNGQLRPCRSRAA
jgi:hypothetical protein